MIFKEKRLYSQKQKFFDILKIVLEGLRGADTGLGGIPSKRFHVVKKCCGPRGAGISCSDPLLVFIRHRLVRGGHRGGSKIQPELVYFKEAKI